MEEKGLVRSASEAGLGTLLSRILGYVRDMVIAAKFGAGAWADAFYVAFRIPNLLRNLLGEGTLGTSFIPVFSEYMVKKEEDAWEIAKIAFSLLLVVLSCLTLLGISITPLIVRVIAPGFSSSPEKFALTVTLTRLMFPFLLFISLAALATALLNSMRSFFIPAFAPAMLSAGEIFSVLVIVPFMGGRIEGLAIGVLLGGIGQFMAQVPQMLKLWPKAAGYFKLTLANPGVRKIFRLMMPAVLGAGVYQINAFVDTICASFLVQGTPTALYYANRLVQLPLAIFGTSIATAALPRMSECAARNDTDGLLNTLASGFRMIFFLLIPSMAGFMVLGKPIISVLFRYGKFDSFAVDLTYSALLFYSLGLVSYAGVKVAASAFYSMQDMKTPVKVSVAAMILNIELNLILMRYLDIGGLALATAISSSINVALLLVFLKRKLGRLFTGEMFVSLWKMCLTGAAVAAVCAGALLWRVNPYVKVCSGIILSVVVFFALSALLRIEETGQVMRIVFRKKSRPV